MTNSLTQTEIAKRTGITPQHLNDVIKRRRKPSITLAKKLETVTGIDRRAWLWPDDFPNPLINISEAQSRYSRG